MKRVKGDAEGKGESGHGHRAGPDEGESGIGIPREEGGVLVRHEEREVEDNRGS